MHLADIGHLKSEEIQLLADSLQPVFALELTPAAETLIQRELLHAFPAICQHSKLTCFVLTATDKGAAYVAAWIEDANDVCACETRAERERPSEPVHKMGACRFCYHGQPRPEATSEQPKRKRMGTRHGWAGFLTLAFALLVFNGCGYYSAPRLIEADGASYVACSGIVRVSSDGGLFGNDPTYSVSFKNDDNMDTVVRGVRNVTVTRIPTMAKSGSQTNLPEPKTDTDGDGTPFVEGSTYLSGPGGKMMTFRNGVWVPEINTACYGPK
jgi:hypothetical protein